MLTPINDNEYYVLYEMMLHALKNDDVKTGINDALHLLNDYLNCGDIILYRKNKEKLYDFFDSSLKEGKYVNVITYIVNEALELIEQKEFLTIDLSNDIYNLKLVSFNTEKHKYIMALNNCSLSKDDNFLNKIITTLQIILKRAELYEESIRDVNIDLLTGLDNRNSYEKRIKKINEIDHELVYGLFDLFRLKYINDNFNHTLGDTYIKETARILKKYWPKNIKTEINGIPQIISTGHCIYRIGGDEFVLMTTKDTLEQANIKANLAAEEVSMINLGTTEELHLGLNCGIVIHNPNDTIKETNDEADKLISSDKQRMYRKYGLDRRR